MGDYILGRRTEIRMTYNTVKNRIDKKNRIDVRQPHKINKNTVGLGGKNNR